MIRSSQPSPSTSNQATPGPSWLKLLRQQWLTREIVERLIDVNMLEQVTNIFEEWWSVERGAWSVDLSFSLRRSRRSHAPTLRRSDAPTLRRSGFPRPVFINFVNAIRLHVTDTTLRFPLRQVTSILKPLVALPAANTRIASSPDKITSAANHLLRLRDRSAEDFDLRADAARIRRLAFKPNGDARSGRVVAIDSDGAIEVIHDHIEIAVVVQIGQSHAVRQRRPGQSPRLC